MATAIEPLAGGTGYRLHGGWGERRFPNCDLRQLQEKLADELFGDPTQVERVGTRLAEVSWDGRRWFEDPLRELKQAGPESDKLTPPGR